MENKIVEADAPVSVRGQGSEGKVVKLTKCGIGHAYNGFHIRVAVRIMESEKGCQACYVQGHVVHPFAPVRKERESAVLDALTWAQLPSRSVMTATGPWHEG